MDILIYFWSSLQWGNGVMGSHGVRFHGVHYKVVMFIIIEK